MDLYNIPNDTKPWRYFQFLKLINGNYIDGAYDHIILKPFVIENNLSEEQKLYLCFLYGLTYSVTSTMRVFKQFPTISFIKSYEVNDFWSKYKTTLYFDEDNRWVKQKDTFSPNLLYIKQNLSYEEVKNIDNFEDMYKYIKSFKGFGSFRAFLVMDLMEDILPHIYKDNGSLPLKEVAHNVLDGMCHLLYKDEYVKKRKYDFKILNKSINRLHTSTNLSLVKLESLLCVFSKYFKGTRYVGFYADRMLKECITYQKYIPSINLMKYRALTIPTYYRSELKGKTGIDKTRLKDFIQKGIL